MRWACKWTLSACYKLANSSHTVGLQVDSVHVREWVTVRLACELQVGLAYGQRLRGIAMCKP